MKEKFAKLIDVKSIITLICTAVFAFLAVTGAVNAEQFLMVFNILIAFYFGTQAVKAKSIESKE